MACVVSLFDTLGGTKDTGGNWYITAKPAGQGLPFNINYGEGVACPTTGNTLNVDTLWKAIGTGEEICVDLTGVEPGDYVFKYVVPDPGDPDDCGVGCNDCSEVTITVIEAPLDGDPIEICENDPTQYFLLTLLNGTPNAVGNWEGPVEWGTGQSPNDNGADDFFTAGDLGPGVFTFTYTVVSDPPGCAECVATVEVTVTSAPMAGDDGSATICV